MPDIDSPLVGLWEKITDSSCSSAYPRQLRFANNGLYSSSGAGAGPSPGWDAGTWRPAEPDRVEISVSNDALVNYHFHVSGSTVTFVDPWNCTFTYRRCG